MIYREEAKGYNMKGFKRFLLEASNKHQIHLEQTALMGVDELRQSIDAARSLRDELAGRSPKKNINVTTKWDGAPAVFTGIHPENGKFFVGGKGVFAKDSKAIFDEESLDQHYPGSGGIKDKLRSALKYLKPLGIKGVLQGDLMFTEGDVKEETIDGKKMLTFRPNTITYAIEKDSPLGKRIANAKIGIVFHTKYQGATIPDMETNASFGIDISYLKKSKDVWYADAYIPDYSGVVNFTAEEDNKVTKMLSDAGKTFHMINKKTFAGLKEVGLFPIMEIYNNTLVRQGKIVAKPSEYLKSFEKFYYEQIEKEKGKRSSEKGKMAQEQKRQTGLDWLSKNKKEVTAMIHIYRLLYDIKMMFVKKFEEITGTVGTFVDTGHGYKSTKPEGFCAVTDQGIVKLIDRLEFSKNNFNLAKKW